MLEAVAVAVAAVAAVAMVAGWVTAVVAAVAGALQVPPLQVWSCCWRGLSRGVARCPELSVLVVMRHRTMISEWMAPASAFPSPDICLTSPAAEAGRRQW